MIFFYFFTDRFQSSEDNINEMINFNMKSSATLKPVINLPECEFIPTLNSIFKLTNAFWNLEKKKAMCKKEIRNVSFKALCPHFF